MTHKKIAVFLRGHIRTWNYVKSHTFAFFEKFYTAENIDWYVLCWKTNTMSLDGLKRSFDNRNLVSCEMIDYDQYPLHKMMTLSELTENFYQSANYIHWKNYQSSYWRLAFLDQLLNLKKIQHEIKHSFEYEKVFFIRPDILYLNDDAELLDTVIETFYISGTDLSFNNDNFEIEPNDLFCQANSITSDIISSRFLDTNIDFSTKQLVHPNSHSIFGQFLLKSCIREKLNFHNLQQIIIRPSMLESLNSKSCLNDICNERDRSAEWIEFDLQKKHRYCEQYGIDPADYINDRDSEF